MKVNTQIWREKTDLCNVNTNVPLNVRKALEVKCQKCFYPHFSDTFNHAGHVYKSCQLSVSLGCGYIHDCDEMFVGTIFCCFLILF